MEEAPGGRRGPGPREQGEGEETGRTGHAGGGGLNKHGRLFSRLVLGAARQVHLHASHPDHEAYREAVMNGVQPGTVQRVSQLSARSSLRPCRQLRLQGSGQDVVPGTGRGSPPLPRAGVCQLAWRPLGDLLRQDVCRRSVLWDLWEGPLLSSFSPKEFKA